MKIKHSNKEPYFEIVYNVEVVCKDDGAHFPRFEYNGFMKLPKYLTSLTDAELHVFILDDLKKNYKKKNGVSFEEQFEDPAFECINISIEKKFFYGNAIKITK